MVPQSSPSLRRRRAVAAPRGPSSDVVAPDYRSIDSINRSMPPGQRDGLGKMNGGRGVQDGRRPRPRREDARTARRCRDAAGTARRASNSSKLQLRGARTSVAAATQWHRAAAAEGGNGRAGRWERITGSAPVVDAGEATNEQRRGCFAGGMVPPMVTWAR